MEEDRGDQETHAGYNWIKKEERGESAEKDLWYSDWEWVEESAITAELHGVEATVWWEEESPRRFAIAEEGGSKASQNGQTAKWVEEKTELLQDGAGE